MKRINAIILTSVIILIIGMAGNHDWAEEVLCEIPCELYQTIKSDLGGDPSDVKIARHYIDNRDHYDSISAINGW